MKKRYLTPWQLALVCFGESHTLSGSSSGRNLRLNDLLCNAFAIALELAPVAVFR